MNRDPRRSPIRSRRNPNTSSRMRLSLGTSRKYSAVLVDRTMASALFREVPEDDEEDEEEEEDDEEEDEEEGDGYSE